MLLQKYNFFTTFPSVGEKRNLSTIAFSYLLAELI